MRFARQLLSSDHPQKLKGSLMVIVKQLDIYYSSRKNEHGCTCVRSKNE